MQIRRQLVLTGVLQGIGCRPTVYRLAVRLGLAGWVINSTSGVRIEIEGPPEQCDAFEAALPAEIPFPGQVRTATVHQVPPQGETSFRIEPSLEDRPGITPIPPDVAVCADCVRELFDPSNPRYLYPFITCTLCGPRFTVVRSFPYDRERTSMADFHMCPRCREEYGTPADRRFHSQTNSCPHCGPRLTLRFARQEEREGINPTPTASEGNPTGRSRVALPDESGGTAGSWGGTAGSSSSVGCLAQSEVLPQAVRLLAAGKVLAIKGIGGFHLACDALNEQAVGTLRQRKGRMEKPFAVMMPDLEAVRQFCRIGPLEEELLMSPVAPIVLLDVEGRRVADNVAPFVGTLGVMLPYSPLHHLLFKDPRVPAEARPTALVMTSGNRSEEPIARDNQEAIDRLHDLADSFVLHDREIVLRADDSVCRVIAGRKTIFRRSRGLVPGGLPVPWERSPGSPVILGAGGDLKNCPAILKEGLVVPGPHVGDLASPVGQEYFKQSVSVLAGYLECEPRVVALDPHPDYFSNSLGRLHCWTSQQCHPAHPAVEEVFHHHAHAVSLLFEHGITGPAVFAVFDGTGYGPDGTIWGGEFLVADVEGFSREGHPGLFALPGGEAAIREPARILADLLARACGGAIPAEIEPVLGDCAAKSRIWLEAARKGINSPLTSSAGRLFDAAAAAAGFARPVTFEGEAAMWLEAIADPRETAEYQLRITTESPLVLDGASLILEMVKDRLGGAPAEACAAKFHNSVARSIALIAGRLARVAGLRTVGLTGGCFQNRLLTEKAVEFLRTTGLRVLLHESVPPNDGGIAIGQVVVAAARWRGK